MASHDGLQRGLVVVILKPSAAYVPLEHLPAFGVPPGVPARKFPFARSAIVAGGRNLQGAAGFPPLGACVRCAGLKYRGDATSIP